MTDAEKRLDEFFQKEMPIRRTGDRISDTPHAAWHVIKAELDRLRMLEEEHKKYCGDPGGCCFNRVVGHD